MPFIKFTESGRSYAAKASLSKTGMISFSNGTRLRFKLDDFGFCVLYYDAETKKIGIEPTKDEKSEGALRIRFRNTGADIAAKSFVDFFNIGVKETWMFPVEVDEETGMMIIEIGKGKKRNR